MSALDNNDDTISVTAFSTLFKFIEGKYELHHLAKLLSRKTKRPGQTPEFIWPVSQFSQHQRNAQASNFHLQLVCLLFSFLFFNTHFSTKTSTKNE